MKDNFRILYISPDTYLTFLMASSETASYIIAGTFGDEIHFEKFNKHHLVILLGLEYT